jgi:hypothetical protein
MAANTTESPCGRVELGRSQSRANELWDLDNTSTRVYRGSAALVATLPESCPSVAVG